MHCFKPHGPIPEGLQVLKAQTNADVQPPVAIPEDEHDEQEVQMLEVVDAPPRADDGSSDDSEESDDEQ